MSRAGWVTYSCEKCGAKWVELSRDAASWSGENCVNDRCDSYPGNCRQEDHEIHANWPVELVDEILQGGRVYRKCAPEPAEASDARTR